MRFLRTGELIISVVRSFPADITSGNNELNKITAFTRLVNIPNTFYIRAVAIQTDNGQIDKGETSISVNVNALDLG